MRGPNSITPRGLRRGQRIDRNAQPCRRAQKQGGVTDRLGRRDQQQLSGSRGSDWMRRTKPSSIAAADERLPEIQKPPASSVAETFRGTSSMASGMPRVSATMRSRTRGSIPPTIDRVQQLARVAVGQALDHQLRQAGQTSWRRRRDGEDQGDRLGQQAPRDEAERLHRHLVEPLRVIDDTEQRLVVGGGGHQAQHRQPDQEAVRGRPDSAAESDVQRLALWFGQLVEVVHQRRAQLLQPGECELHVGLHAGHVTCGTRTPAPTV